MVAAPDRFRLSFHLLLIASVSTHTAYAQEPESKSYPILSGVGIALRSEDGQLFVTTVIPKSPAERSRRIHAGDKLVSIETNGKSTPLYRTTIGEAASLIRGPVETDLILTLVPRDAETPIRVKLRRAPLQLSGVAGSSYKAFIGKRVSNLKLSSLDDQPAENLSDHFGKIVVLDFWASWCPTCYPPVTKMQSIAESNPRWEGKVELITVSVDSDLSRAIKTIKENGWNSTTNVTVNFDELKALGVSVVPVVIIIRPDGTIATMAGSHAVDIEKEVNALFPDQRHAPIPVEQSGKPERD